MLHIAHREAILFAAGLVALLAVVQAWSVLHPVRPPPAVEPVVFAVDGVDGVAGYGPGGAALTCDDVENMLSVNVPGTLVLAILGEHRLDDTSCLSPAHERQLRRSVAEMTR
jgi:hypothetical protein